MPKLSSITSSGGLVDAVVAFGDEKVRVTFDPNAYTPAFELQLEEAHNEGSPYQSDQTVRLLAAVLRGWDIVDDDGAEVPVTVDQLRALPLRFLSEVVKAVGDAMRPEDAEGKGSFSG